MKRELTAALLCSAVLLASPAYASFDASGSIAAFTGSDSFSVTVGSDTLGVTVDFAVWSPGTFGGSISALFDVATEHLFAYQVTIGPNSSLSAFDVLADGALISVAGSDAALDAGAGVAPTGVTVNSSVLYQFGIGNLIAPGSSSDVLLFTSPFIPVMGFASGIDGGLSGTLAVPVPDPARNVIPVPGAALLGMMGMGLVGWTRRRLN